MEIPSAGRLEVRRTSERTRTHYVRHAGGGADVLVVTGSRSVLSRVLDAYNATVRDGVWLCRCGCGGEVREGYNPRTGAPVRYRPGHNLRGAR